MTPPRLAALALVGLLGASPAAASPVTLTWQGLWGYYDADVLSVGPDPTGAWSSWDFIHDIAAGFNIPPNPTGVLTDVPVKLSLTMDGSATPGSTGGYAVPIAIRFTAGTMSIGGAPVLGSVHTSGNTVRFSAAFDPTLAPLLGLYQPQFYQVDAVASSSVPQGLVLEDLLLHLLETPPSPFDHQYLMSLTSGCCDSIGTLSLVSVSVPEPSSLLLVLPALIVALRHRRARRSSTSLPS